MSAEQERFDYDVAVIGGGSAGYAAARTAAKGGLGVVVIEGGEQVGGLCILRGCMPTKALLYSAEIMHLARKAPLWGITASDVSFDFQKVMARKSELIRDFASYRSQELTTGNFKFIRAQGRFVDPHTLALSTGGTLRARYFVISSGSVVSPPPLAQLKKIPYMTSDEALELVKPPKSLIVLGGGAVAVEFAQFFSRFDVKVTVIQRSAHLLSDCDCDAAVELEAVFRREGIELFTGTKLLDAWHGQGRKGVAFEHDGKKHRVEAEEVLFALGRVPNTAMLDLAKAGVVTANGAIVTSDRMQTSAPHIYAAGDCVGRHEIVHVAIQQGEVAGHNIARPEQPRSMDYRLFMSVIFTEPQIASVGLCETEAREKGISCLTAKYRFADHGKSLIMDVRDGFVKLLASPSTGEILGGTCVGPSAGDLIHEITAAMHKRMTVQELATMPHYHPTLAEIWAYPAEELAEKIGEVTELSKR